MPKAIHLRAKTFYRWLRANFTKGQLVDMANHGADGGWHGMIYTVDMLKLYDRYRDELWELAAEYADDLGIRTLAVLARRDRGPGNTQFGDCPYIDDHDTLATHMVWFAAEYLASRVRDGDDEPEEG